MMRNQIIRNAINEALPWDTSPHGRQPQLGDIYVPNSHLKALRLDSTLIVGTRGVGKTFWSSALRDTRVLGMLGADMPDLVKTDVYAGFGEGNEENYPEKNIFKQLLSKNFEAYSVWRGVLARWAAKKLEKNIPIDDWESTVGWVVENPEPFSKLIRELNEKLKNQDSYGLIIFDALDRASSNWMNMDKIVKELLMVSLEMKFFSNIFVKIFLRDDQYKRSEITSFPDASKITTTRVDLQWSKLDLYGLLWQYFCNANGEGGETLREFIHDNGVKTKEYHGVWTVESSAKKDEAVQRKIFEAIAGKWMGKNSRRGNTYEWCVNHLADGYGRTSPRSFIAAIKKASGDEKYQSHEHPLHYESIKMGVREASEIRVSELKEDYPWIQDIMLPLKRLNVPCDFGDIVNKWEMEFKNKKPEEIFGENDKLPPAHYKEGWDGVRSDLENLGIFSATKDNRINMPDLYRIAFEIGRKGGVPPRPKKS